MILTSIPHSGTHFLINLLGIEFPWRPELLGWSETHKASPRSIFFDHLIPHQKKIYLPLMQEHLTILPLRHPRSVDKSWRDRDKPMDTLDEMWKVLVHDVAPLGALFLPLDSPRKEYFKREIESAVGRKLPTDWEPLGKKCGNHATHYTEYEPVPIEAEIGGFLSRFYDVSRET